VGELRYCHKGIEISVSIPLTAKCKSIHIHLMLCIVSQYQRQTVRWLNMEVMLHNARKWQQQAGSRSCVYAWCSAFAGATVQR
jgi:hypothetical protein